MRIVTRGLIILPFFGNPVAFVLPSPSCNFRQLVTAVLDNERIDSFLFMLKAPEDVLPGALLPLYKMDAVYFSIICSVCKCEKSLKKAFIKLLQLNESF